MMLRRKGGIAVTGRRLKQNPSFYIKWGVQSKHFWS